MNRFIRHWTSAISNGGQKQEKLDINEVKRVEVMWLKQLQQPFYNTNNFKELKLSRGIYKDENDLLRCNNKAELPVNSKKHNSTSKSRTFSKSYYSRCTYQNRS